jgi:SAM-dependent methyltransferase
MTTLTSPLEHLAEEYAAWWIDILGEHNHIGGADATHWLLERARLAPGRAMLDCGAFVGAAARMAATTTGATAVACDLNSDFLAAGRQMDGGELVHWVAANSRRLPFRDGAFQSAWVLDSDISLSELTRITSPGATLCLCCEVPVDGRGGVEAFIDELGDYGWTMAAHRQMSLEATNTWRTAEADLVRRRPYFEARYGTRPYLAQLDMLGSLVQSYERLEQGHGLFVFERR